MKTIESQALAVEPGHFSRILVLLGVSVLTVTAFGPALKAAITMALSDDRYLPIVVAPPACALLMFLRRMEIFQPARYSPRVGIPLLALALVLGLLALYVVPDTGGDGLLPGVCGAIVIWFAAFILCFGVQSFRAALYPLGCIFLMIPLPSSWMDQVTGALQHGSATLSYGILWALGVPVLRHGMQLSVPGLTIEVAPECSGIHSSLALLMIAVVAGYVYLRSGFARLALILLSIPIAIFKNAVRIVVISLLGAYVDRAFVYGSFHHQYGGLIFSMVGVMIFVPLLAGLQRIENRRRNRRRSGVT